MESCLTHKSIAISTSTDFSQPSSINPYYLFVLTLGKEDLKHLGKVHFSLVEQSQRGWKFMQGPDFSSINSFLLVTIYGKKLLPHI